MEFLRFLKTILRFFKSLCVNLVCVPYVEVMHRGFWNYRMYLIKKGKNRTSIYNAYLERNSASIGVLSIFKSVPTLPHGLHGIHVSDGAKIGENVTIMQNVTIGSNTLKDSKKTGAPTVGDRVFIGANASIIGGIKIGSGCRIGANCCVFMDCPDNQTVVLGGVKTINHWQPKDNTFSNYYPEIHGKAVKTKDGNS